MREIVSFGWLEIAGSRAQGKQVFSNKNLVLIFKKDEKKEVLSANTCPREPIAHRPAPGWDGEWGTGRGGVAETAVLGFHHVSDLEPGSFHLVNILPSPVNISILQMNKLRFRKITLSLASPRNFVSHSRRGKQQLTQFPVPSGGARHAGTSAREHP